MLSKEAVALDLARSYADHGEKALYLSSTGAQIAGFFTTELEAPDPEMDKPAKRHRLLRSPDILEMGAVVEDRSTGRSWVIASTEGVEGAYLYRLRSNA